MAYSDRFDTATPDQVDLRDFLWPVENVSRIPAAAAAAFTTALEYHCNRTGDKPADLSTMFVHYNARRLRGNENKNIGTTMSDAMKAIATFGACGEATWPFDPAVVTTAPSAQAYEDGKRLTNISYAVAADPFEALALRYPLPFVVKIPQRCLDAAGRDGVVPAPTADELQRLAEHPAHAMVLVGYDRSGKTFTARNCWGEKWGDNGYCRVPFGVMNVLAPADSGRIWMLASSVASAAHAARAAVPAPPPAPVPQTETIASLAARMKAEIRSDLQRDLADAGKRIKDRF
jgi:hypothetical protein